MWPMVLLLLNLIHCYSVYFIFSLKVCKTNKIPEYMLLLKRIQKSMHRDLFNLPYKRVTFTQLPLFNYARVY